MRGENRGSNVARVRGELRGAEKVDVLVEYFKGKSRNIRMELGVRVEG